MRIEIDNLGEVKLEDESYIGIETSRALDNFPISNYKLHKEFVIAFAYVKLAAAQINIELGYLDSELGNAICETCEEIIDGKWHEHILVDPFQGGAGTSTNMNFNEVISNVALEKLGYKKGDYSKIHPIHHVNLHQSTNDVYPTALRVAVLFYLKKLEAVVTEIQETFQKKELEFKDIIKLGRTQLQDAVPMTLGMSFSAFAEAIARDRWRIFKSRERIKTVNLGGTAIGTGLGAPRKYIFKVTERLRKLTGLAISRSETLVDATQNLDPFVEISGMLKAYATNLFKISSDLRLMSSGPVGGLSEIQLPPVQPGSTIMPGKVNPVIPEMVSQVALKVIANDSLITSVATLGQLELNQFLPLLCHSILESLYFLINATEKFNHLCVKGIIANKSICQKMVYESKTLATILVPILGYKNVEKILKISNETDKDIQEILIEDYGFSKKEIEDLLSPSKMYKLGFSKNETKR